MGHEDDGQCFRVNDSKECSLSGFNENGRKNMRPIILSFDGSFWVDNVLSVKKSTKAESKKARKRWQGAQNNVS